MSISQKQTRWDCVSLLTAVSLFVAAAAMDICYSASGERVVSLPPAVVDGKPVRWIKGSDAKAIGMSRHRQRLFLREELLSDNYTFTCSSGPLVVQLVILPFVPHDPVVTSELNFAAAQN